NRQLASDPIGRCSRTTQAMRPWPTPRTREESVMRSAHLRLWLGTSFIGISLLAGCNHSRHCDCACNTGCASGPTMVATPQYPTPTPRLQPMQSAEARPTVLPSFTPSAKSDVSQTAHSDSTPTQMVFPAAVPPETGPWTTKKEKEKEQAVQQVG